MQNGAAEGERDVTAVDSNSAVERELRVRVELQQPRSSQERRTQQDLQSRVHDDPYDSTYCYSAYRHSIG